MTGDRRRRPADLARAGRAAFRPGDYVGQESFCSAAEFRDLARAAGIGCGSRVIDLCCGAGAFGRLLVGEWECTYLGVDASADAIDAARALAGSDALTYRRAPVPPVPAGVFDVALLVGTLLAFRTKSGLFRAIRGCLTDIGRFAFTAEIGAPLSTVEAAMMPAADTVWPIPRQMLIAELSDAGFDVRDVRDVTDAHAHVAARLADEYSADRDCSADAGDREMFDGLVRSHRVWARWLSTGRVRKLACVAAAH